MIERCYFKFSVGAVPSCPNRLSATPGGVGSQATPRTRCADVRALRDEEEDRDGAREKEGGSWTPRGRDSPLLYDEIRAEESHTPRGVGFKTLYTLITEGPVDSAWRRKSSATPWRVRKKNTTCFVIARELTRVYSSNPNCDAGAGLESIVVSVVDG